MNTTSRIGWRALNARTLTALAGLCLGWAVWGGEGPGPDQIREEARKMEEKARDLKAAGQGVEADEIMREVRKMRTKFEPTAPRSDERPAVAERRLELRRRMGELERELKRRSEEGQEAEAAELRQQIAQLEGELGRAAGGRGEPQLGRREGPRPGGRPEAMEAARRLEHLQRAVENLRAGGMPEIAARLEQEGQRMRERMERGGARGGPVEEVERLRAEVQELRQAMQQLKRRLEEVAQRQPQSEHRNNR